MPWNRNAQARGHTKKANSPKKQRQWRHVANEELKRTGSESRAIRAANSVVARSKRSNRRSSRK
jgi:hypothetical protein